MNEWDAVVSRHPAAAALRRLFPDPRAAGSPGFSPTRLKRADYLPVIAGNVDFFKNHQDARGAIIDPFEKKERQYSTPAFALAAATLVTQAGRADLQEPAFRALTFALEALANRTPADNHPDFYIPLVVRARRLLAGHAPQATFDNWTRLLESLVPEETYRDVEGRANWNVVNIAGECLRRRDGLVPQAQKEAHAAYLEQCLERQEKRYTQFGMYEDPNAPLAYDAFPRLWLEDVLADGAYDGPRRARLEEFLTLGGLSTLLLLSPIGEWANGGRSAHHQWNEAEAAVICEINARRWKERGRPDIAGAFKRAARLALTSMKRWQRPSGEMWIVKNRAEPSLRHGYENYSFHSQYNLLAVAMLAIVHAHADDTIEERPIPSEVGGYVFDLRDTFHKICASAGGTYLLIDTSADAHYNATGLVRVHKAGVPFSPLSDNAASHRSYGPPGEGPRVGMSPGIAWKEQEAGAWRSLADFHHPKDEKNYGPTVARGADLRVHAERPDHVAFTVRYELSGEGARPVEEEYVVSAAGVEVTARVSDTSAPAAVRAVFPLLVSDGASDTRVTVMDGQAWVTHGGAVLTCELLSPSGARLALDSGGPRVATRNGFMQAAVADLPAGTREVRWRLRLEAA